MFHPLASLPRAVGWLCLVCALTVAGCTSKPVPSSAEAIVTLSPEVLSEGPVALTDGWEARPGIEGALQAARTTAGWTPVDIKRSFRMQGYPDQGSVSYRLRVQAPATRMPLRGSLQHANNAHRLWAVLPSGEVRLLASSGQVADAPDEARMSRRPVLFALPRASEYTLVWQITNAGYPRGGPFYPVYVGLEQHMQRAVLHHVVATIVLTSFFLALCIVALLGWMQDAAEAPALVLALLALLAAMMTMAQSGLLEHLVDLTFDRRVQLEMFAALALPPTTGLLLWTAMPWAFSAVRTRWGLLQAPAEPGGTIRRLATRGRDLPLRYRRVNTWATAFVLVVGTLAAAASLVLPTEAMGYLLLPGAISLGVIFGVMLMLSAQVVWIRHPLGWFFLTAFASLALVGLHDLLMVLGLAPDRVYLLGYGYAAFFILFCTAYVTLRLRAARRAEAANIELRQRVEARSLEVQEASRAAQVAYLAKSQFLAAVSHELRTPLAAMMGYAHLLDEEIGGTLAPEHREFLQTIETSGDRLLGLINDLLDLSRIEAGRFDLHVAPVSANSAARDICRQLHPLAHEKGLVFDLATDLDDDAYVVADPARLRQILINLVSNAVKFTETGGVCVRVYWTSLDEQDAIAFAVEDTGVGISPDFLPHVFDLFAQEASRYAQTQRGTGLGLHLARELAERMHGTITVDSVPAHGSVFTVTLPAALQPGDGTDMAVRLTAHR